MNCNILLIYAVNKSLDLKDDGRILLRHTILLLRCELIVRTYREPFHAVVLTPSGPKFLSDAIWHKFTWSRPWGLYDNFRTPYCHARREFEPFHHFQTFPHYIDLASIGWHHYSCKICALSPCDVAWVHRAYVLLFVEKKEEPECHWRYIRNGNRKILLGSIPHKNKHGPRSLWLANFQKKNWGRQRRSFLIYSVLDFCRPYHHALLCGNSSRLFHGLLDAIRRHWVSECRGKIRHHGWTKLFIENITVHLSDLVQPDILAGLRDFPRSDSWQPEGEPSHRHNSVTYSKFLIRRRTLHLDGIKLLYLKLTKTKLVLGGFSSL